MHRLVRIAGASAALVLAGCCNCPTSQTASEYVRNQPTLPMEVVVAAINANNQKIPSLWATLNYSATINDNGQVHSVSSDDGVMLYMNPDHFRLVGKKEFVGTVFDLGTNGREYWLEVVPGTNRLWWGRYTDLAGLNPGRMPLPIPPNLVLEVLGVAVINTDFNVQPVPTMRYVNGAGADSYVFIFNVHAPTRWLAQKEVWYDRKTFRPRKVILYDARGRPVLQALLSHDTKVQAAGSNRADWPLVAGDYKLFFPDSGSRMEFTLNDVQLSRRGFPNRVSFQLPEVQGTDIRAIQIGGGGGE